MKRYSAKKVEGSSDQWNVVDQDGNQAPNSSASDQQTAEATARRLNDEQSRQDPQSTRDAQRDPQGRQNR